MLYARIARIMRGARILILGLTAYSLKGKNISIEELEVLLTAASSEISASLTGS